MGVEAVALVVDLPDRPQVARAAVGAASWRSLDARPAPPRCRRGGPGAGPARAAPGSAAPVAAAPPSSLRRETLFSHSFRIRRLLKHILGKTKYRATGHPLDREYDRHVIATSEYELVTESAGLVERSERAMFVVRGGEAADFLQGQVSNDVEGARPRAGLLRDDPQPQGQAAHRPARPARRRLLLARHRGDRPRGRSATCSAPTRSGATCSGRTSATRTRCCR